jgi:hypothetical protein
MVSFGRSWDIDHNWRQRFLFVVLLLIIIIYFDFNLDSTQPLNFNDYLDDIIVAWLKLLETVTFLDKINSVVLVAHVGPKLESLLRSSETLDFFFFVGHLDKHILHLSFENALVNKPRVDFKHNWVLQALLINSQMPLVRLEKQILQRQLSAFFDGRFN